MRRIVYCLMLSMVVLSASTMDTIDKHVAQITSTLMDAMQKEHISRIAIGDFQTNGVKSMFERYVENEIVNAIASKASNRIKVIERRRLSEVLEEQKLGSMGLLEKSTRAAIGKILGAGAIVSGETIVTTKEAKVNVRLYAVTTGRILLAESFTLTRDNTTDELMSEPVLDVSKRVVSKSHTTHAKFHNRAKQKIDYILVTVKDVKILESKIVVTLKFVSMRRDMGASVAVYAEGSDNIADFWKFFPKPKIVTLSDSNHNSYPFKSTTMKYAKTRHDWTTIQPNSEQIVQCIFSKKRGESVGKYLTFTLLIYTVTADKKGKARKSSATLYFDGLVAN